MKSAYLRALYILLLAVAIYLYLWRGWVAVGIAVAVVVLLWLVCSLPGRKSVPKQTSVVAPEKVQQSVEEQTLARRRAQGEVLRTFALATKGRADVDRLVERLMDWHLEYCRTNGIYHEDLYDFLLNKCKARLSTAEADYLRRELRLSITIIRNFMRGRSVEQVLEILE